jgi:hypothetical protein
LELLAARTKEATGAGLAAKVALALIAVGEDPSVFGGTDLMMVIEAGFNPSTGFYGPGPYDSALAILALSQAGQEVPAEAIRVVECTPADGSHAFDGA